MRKKTTHQYCLHNLVHNDLLSRETISPIHYDKNDINRLQEINLKAHKEQTLISKRKNYRKLFFYPSVNEISLSMVLTNVFQPKKKNSHQRLSTLKFPPLISKVSISCSSLTKKVKNEVLYSV